MTSCWNFVRRAGLLLGAAGFVVACAAERQVPPPSPARIVLPDDRNLTPTDAVAQESRPGQGLIELMAIEGSALGPRLVATSRGHVVIWSELEGEEPALFSQSISKQGVVAARARLVPFDASARLLQLGLSGSGAIVASAVRRAGDQDVLEALVLGPSGELRGGPYVLAETPAAVLYTQIVASPRGALVFWVERTGSLADLWVVAVEGRGPRRPARLVRHLTAWQIVDSKMGLTVATREGKAHPGIYFRQIGASGQVLGSPIPVARDVRGGLDLDVAMTKERIVVGYSSTEASGSSVVLAPFDLGGNPLGPITELTAPRGAQALVRLLGSEEDDRVTAIWEEPLRASHGLPSMLVGTSAEGGVAVEPAAAFSVSRQDPLLPLIARHGRDLAIVTDSFCRFDGEDAGACRIDASSRSATLLDANSKSTRLLDLTLPSGRAPSMAWDLDCTGSSCALLLAGSASPADIYLAPVENLRVSEVHEKRAVTILDPARARVTRTEIVSQVPELNGLAAKSLGTGDEPKELLAWVSYFDPEQPYVIPSAPAPDGRRAPVRARLSTVSVESSSSGPKESTSVISYRARSLGKVALVAPEGESGLEPGLLAWAAVDGTDPQLFATLVDAKGQRVRQKMLTRTPGEVSDVAAIRVDNGFMIAWVDGRTGSPEVFAVTVDESLNAVGDAQRVSHGARAPADVALIHAFGGVVSVWSDARGADSAGHAHLYSARLNAANGRPLSAEQKFSESGGHAHGARLAVQRGESERLVACWIESRPGEGTDSGVARCTWSTELGKPSSPAFDLPTPPTAGDLSVHCDERGCRAVVVAAGDSGDGGLAELWGVDLSSPEALRADLLQPLWSDTPSGVLPVLLGDLAYLADRDPDTEGWRLQRLTIDWGSSAP